jgi:hypothetical protein
MPPPRYRKPGFFTARVFNPAVAFLAGRPAVSMKGARVLSVRGRKKSGEWHSTPVNLLSFRGQRYLVAPRGETQWVRNIRVSREGRLTLAGALVGALHRDADTRAGLQIDRMLGLVGQMRAPVLHPGDFGIGIARMRPLVVRPLLLALPIEPRQVGPRRRANARGLRQPSQKLLVALREHRAMRFDDNEAARPGNRRVVRRHVVQIQPQEIP